MEFTVSRNALLAALNRVKHVIYPKGAFSPLKTIVFTFPEEDEVKSMTIHTSDGEQWISETVPVIIEPKTADAPQPVRSFSVWYYNFIRAIRSLDEQPLTFRIGEMQMAIHHECGSFRLPLEESTGEFLAIPKPCPDGDASDGFSMEYEAPVLRSLLTKCSYAMADDELRPALTGVYMNLTKDFSDYISSDGHKLVRIRKQAIATNGSGDCCLVIPARTVRTLLRILPPTGDVLFEYQEKLEKKKTRIVRGCEKESYTVVERRAAVRITIDDMITLLFYPVDGKYPKYWAVIPETHNYDMVINRRKLIKSVDRLSIFANTSSEMITLNIGENLLRMTGDDYDFSADGEENLPCEYKGVDGKQAQPLRMGFKASSLSAILKHLSTEEVVFQFTDSSRAALILSQPQPEFEEVTMLLMPMLVND